MSTPRNLLLAALMASSGNAVAASSVDLAVKGSITPSACTPELPNSGNVDLGKFSAKDLRADQPTSLPAQGIQLTVTCNAKTLMALEAKDNREGSDYENDTNYFGLGLINGSEKLGAMSLSLISPMADNVAAQMIHSEDGGANWNRGRYLYRNNIVSVAGTTGLEPLPVQLFTAEIWIAAKIAPARDLNLTSEAKIDGSVTLTVRYL